jgi:hypothetical protein
MTQSSIVVGLLLLMAIVAFVEFQITQADPSEWFLKQKKSNFFKLPPKS